MVVEEIKYDCRKKQKQTVSFAVSLAFILFFSVIYSIIKSDFSYDIDIHVFVKEI